MVNRVTLVGRVGKQPEHRALQNTSVSNLSLATTESWTDQQGQRQQKTEWHQVVAWGKLAEVIHRHVGKGDMLYVEGKIVTEQYDKDGETRYSTKVVAREVKFLTPRSAKQGAQPQQQAYHQAPPAGQHQASSPQGQGANPLDDIPF